MTGLSKDFGQDRQDLQLGILLSSLHTHADIWISVTPSKQVVNGEETVKGFVSHAPRITLKVWTYRIIDRC